MTPDHARLADLAEFARIEIEARDVEPWADVLRALVDHGDVDVEQAHWLVKGYNAFDALGAAWGLADIWPGPDAYGAADPAERLEVLMRWMPTQERRNLRGGRIVKHYDSYLGYLAGLTQDSWVRMALLRDDPGLDFHRLLAHVRVVWGVGRQTAFEWAEFLAKVLDLPVVAPDAVLWESEGPRRSLQRLYGNPTPDRAWLDDAAATCRGWLADQGIDLSWEDFETIICDFNVMRDGRYYPGRHLAALREEIAEAGDPLPLVRAWDAVVPDEWADIAPGIDKAKMPVYRDSGQIIRRAA